MFQYINSFFYIFVSYLHIFFDIHFIKNNHKQITYTFTANNLLTSGVPGLTSKANNLLTSDVPGLTSKANNLLTSDVPGLTSKAINPELKEFPGLMPQNNNYNIYCYHCKKNIKNSTIFCYFDKYYCSEKCRNFYL
jgi:hypothetical protein